MPRSPRIDPFVRHAITPPLFGKGKVHRVRLVDLILGNISKKLIVIAAPAGYGKTTLLADFAAHADLHVCWLQLRHEGTDLVEFAGLLRASLNKRFRRLKGKPRERELAALTPRAMARLFADVIEEGIEEPFVIAIDEIQEVNRTKEHLEFLDSLVDLLPAHVTMVAAGRVPPEVSLAKLMAAGELAGIGPQDLALTRDELMALLKHSPEGERVPSFADELLEETRGWITGVLLSRELGRASGSLLQFRGRPMVYEYLASVVLGRIPEEMRRFMRKSSILPVMTSSLCDELLQIDESAKHLSAMARQGLFLTETEDSPKTYEYHPLFRKFLLDELGATDPGLMAKLRLKAARYQEERGLPEEAVSLYLEAGKPRHASRVAERLARDMVKRGKVRTLEGWAQALREGGVPSISVLRLLAISHVDRGRLDEAETLLSELETIVGQGTPRELRGAVENLRGLIAYRRGRYEEVTHAVEHAEVLLRQRPEDFLHLGMSKRLKALAQAAGGGDFHVAEELSTEAIRYLELAGEPYSLAQGLSDLFGYQQFLGKPLDAWKTITRAHRILQEVGSPLPLAMCTGNLGLILHQRGRYEEALTRLEEAGRLARRAGSSLIEAQAILAQADLFSDLAMFHEAGQLFERALEMASTIGDPGVLGFGCLKTSVLHRRARNNALAEGWLARAEDLGGANNKLQVSIRVQRAALMLPEESPAAVRVLKDVLEGSSRMLDAFDLTLAQFWLARGLHLIGETFKAKSALGEALHTGRRMGSEQAIVGEVNCSAEIKAFVSEYAVDAEAVLRIQDRLQMMEVLARSYQQSSATEVEPGRLEVRALGKGAARFGGSTLRNLKPLHRDVLYYIVDRQRADRDQLADEFWSEQPPGRQTANLHMAIYSLRRILGKATIAHDGRYYSVAEGVSVLYDVGKFEKAAAAALRLPPGDPRRYFALTDAVTSFGGRYLEGNDQRWAVTRRRELDGLFLQLAEFYSGEAIQRGAAAAAISVLARALDIDPLSDILNLRHIEALGELGRRSDLVRSYSRYVRLLAEELGLDPPMQVSATYTRLIG